ncbi:hypothetical protein ACTG9Q_14965 [Actinokineospora sp. 24-640]
MPEGEIDPRLASYDIHKVLASAHEGLAQKSPQYATASTQVQAAAKKATASYDRLSAQARTTLRQYQEGGATSGTPGQRCVSSFLAEFAKGTLKHLPSETGQQWDSPVHHDHRPDPQHVLKDLQRKFVREHVDRQQQLLSSRLGTLQTRLVDALVEADQKIPDSTKALLQKHLESQDWDDWGSWDHVTEIIKEDLQEKIQKVVQEKLRKALGEM